MAKTRIKVIERGNGGVDYIAQVLIRNPGSLFYPFRSWNSILYKFDTGIHPSLCATLESAQYRIDGYLAKEAAEKEAKRLLKVKKVRYVKYP
jgi:hypothetical protein